MHHTATKIKIKTEIDFNIAESEIIWQFDSILIKMI